jgi:hypothetical protein
MGDLEKINDYKNWSSNLYKFGLFLFIVTIILLIVTLVSLTLSKSNLNDQRTSLLSIQHGLDIILLSRHYSPPLPPSPPLDPYDLSNYASSALPSPTKKVGLEYDEDNRKCGSSNIIQSSFCYNNYTWRVTETDNIPISSGIIPVPYQENADVIFQLFPIKEGPDVRLGGTGNVTIYNSEDGAGKIASIVLVLEKSISPSPGNSFGPSGKNFLRLGEAWISAYPNSCTNNVKICNTNTMATVNASSKNILKVTDSKRNPVNLSSLMIFPKSSSSCNNAIKFLLDFDFSIASTLQNSILRMSLLFTYQTAKNDGTTCTVDINCDGVSEPYVKTLYRRQDITVPSKCADKCGNLKIEGTPVVTNSLAKANCIDDSLSGLPFSNNVNKTVTILEQTSLRCFKEVCDDEDIAMSTLFTASCSDTNTILFRKKREFIAKCLCDPTTQVVGVDGRCKCLPGYAPVNEFTRTCIPCSGGSVSVDGIGCYPCGIGQVPNLNKTGCVSCLPGTVTYGPGYEVCLRCSIGYFSPPERDGCKSCSDGYSTTIDNPDECKPCLPNYYSNPITNRICMPCSYSTFSEAGSSTCTPCTIDTFAQSAHTCVPCPLGQSAPSVSDHCYSCEPGFEAISGTQNCQACDKGYYSNSNTNTICTKCQAGSFSDKIQSNLCAPCPSGYSSESGSSTCRPCQVDTYSIEGGLCQACPNLTHKALGYPGECILCKDGFELSFEWNGCISCGNGYFSNIDTNRLCTQCPENTFTNVNSGYNICNKCRSNEYSKPGSSDCVRCNQGYYYSPSAIVRQQCIACGDGTTNTMDFLGCVNCSAGFYSDTSTNHICQPCPDGTFSSTETDFVCQPIVLRRAVLFPPPPNPLYFTTNVRSTSSELNFGWSFISSATIVVKNLTINIYNNCLPTNPGRLFLRVWSGDSLDNGQLIGSYYVDFTNENLVNVTGYPATAGDYAAKASDTNDFASITFEKNIRYSITIKNPLIIGSPCTQQLFFVNQTLDSALTHKGLVRSASLNFPTPYDSSSTIYQSATTPAGNFYF